MVIFWNNANNWEADGNGKSLDIIIQFRMFYPPHSTGNNLKYTELRFHLFDAAVT